MATKEETKRMRAYACNFSISRPLTFCQCFRDRPPILLVNSLQVPPSSSLVAKTSSDDALVISMSRAKTEARTKIKGFVFSIC